MQSIDDEDDWSNTKANAQGQTVFVRTIEGAGEESKEEEEVGRGIQTSLMPG